MKFQYILIMNDLNINKHKILISFNRLMINTFLEQLVINNKFKILYFINKNI